jgi:alpha-N-acetylglucosaminidase
MVSLFQIACLLVIFMCMLMAKALPAPPTGTAAAALASLTRILGRDASTVFAVQLSNTTGNCASASGGGNRLVTLTASSAIDAVFIAGQYLKAEFHANFAWQLNGGVQVSNLPPVGSFFPAVPGGSLSMCRSVPYTYYQNVVQSSYSNVWWSYGNFSNFVHLFRSQFPIHSIF